jgi:PadR family transcriptional regulator, regulatory protein PadR
MSKNTLGELEELVLLAILRLGDQAYGLSIARELERTAHRPVQRASVYVLLRRLEQAGLIESRRETAEEAQGKPRRFVHVTTEGVTLVRESRSAMLRMWSGIEHVLEEG